MSLAADIANDWQFMDGVETVTVLCGSTEVTGAKGLPCKAELSDLATALLTVEQESRVWSVWKSTLDGNEIRIGDKITGEDGRQWIVNKSDLATLATRYRCICTRARQ